MRLSGAWRAAVIAVTGAACAVAVVMRFVAPSPMWLDEALSVNIAQLGFADVVDALTHDGHPPGYYLLLGWWMDLFGGSDSAARALSGVCSLLAAVVVWAAARRRFSGAAAWFATVLALTSPFLIRYGAEARMYALVVLLAALGWWLTELCLQRRHWLGLAVLAVVVAAGLYTHYWMIWLVVASVGALVVAWLRCDKRTNISFTIGAYAAGCLAFVPWLGVLAQQAAHTATPWATRARPAEVAVEAVQAIGGGRRFEPVLLGMLLVGVAVIGATARSERRPFGGDSSGLLLGWPGRHRGGPLVAVAATTLVVGGLVALVGGTAFEARYTAVVVPLVLALAGRGVSALGPRLAAGGLVVLALFGVAVAVDDARRDRGQGFEVAEAINEQGGHNDVIVTCPDQLAPSVLRYLEIDARVLTFPATPDPRRVDWYDYAHRIATADPAATATAALELATSGDSRFPDGAWAFRTLEPGTHEEAINGASQSSAGTRTDSQPGPVSVWLVMAPGYHGFDLRCESLAAELGAARGQHLVVNGREVYEPMFLFHYPAAGT